MTKTYGVYHLTEWQLNLKVDRMTIPVHFTGGSTTSFGAVPATYTTSNEAMQYLIEHLPEYKSGRIVLFSVKR